MLTSTTTRKKPLQGTAFHLRYKHAYKQDSLLYHVRGALIDILDGYQL